jgi:hypothetical protein
VTEITQRRKVTAGIKTKNKNIHQLRKESQMIRSLKDLKKRKPVIPEKTKTIEGKMTETEIEIGIGILKRLQS